MSDEVRNPEDGFSHNEAHMISFFSYNQVEESAMTCMQHHLHLNFFYLLITSMNEAILENLMTQHQSIMNKETSLGRMKQSISKHICKIME